MKAIIPRTLRWQIILALFALVIVTLVVSWSLALHFTARDFEDFIRDDALDQAREYAYLLEARYNLHGGFGNLEDLLQGLGDMDPEDLVEADDEPAMDDIAIPEWDWIIARTLGLPYEEYRAQRESSTPDEIAWDHGVPPDELVIAIMREEAQWLALAGVFEEADAVYSLGSLLAEVEEYVAGFETYGFGEGFYDIEELGLPLLYQAPIVVVDASGTILFDGLGEKGEGRETALDDDADRLPIRDWTTGTTVGFVLPSRDPWFYDVDELTYLAQTRNGLLIGGGIAAILALVLGVFLSHRISRPVTALRDSAVRLAEGEPGNRLPVTPGELGSMSAAFNAMADSLEQQREVRSRMVSDLSHELNTPLAVIQLEIEAMRDSMQSPSEAAEHVLAELDLLRNLASDVGLLAENEAGLLSIHKETVDLADFIPTAVQRWKTRADSVGIALEIKGPGHPVLVELDRTRISQALGNLIRNALQHTAAGGTIQVHLGRRPLERLGGIWNTICVADTGTGIAPEQLDRIFERTVQAHAKKTGRGLGLTIVRQIIEAHGGHVWAESTLGEGSIFCIALP